MMFKTKIFLQGCVAVLGSALIGLMLSTSAFAANPETVTVEVEFIDPLVISTTFPLRYGLIDVNLAGGDTIQIDPDDTVTESTPRVAGGTQAAAELSVTGTASRAITILVDNIVNNTGYTLGSFMCNYDGPDGACDGLGLSETSIASATLDIGATLTGTGLAGLGVVNGAFDVTITYD